jgi:lysozyme family protein
LANIVPVTKQVIINYVTFANIRLEIKMLQKFRQWYLKNQTEITWFLIGFLCYSGLISLGRGDYIGAAIVFGIAYINYYMHHKA